MSGSYGADGATGRWDPLPPTPLDRWCYRRREGLLATLALAALVTGGAAVWVTSTGRAGYVLLPVAALLVVQIAQLHVRLRRVGVRIEGERARGDDRADPRADPRAGPRTGPHGQQE